MIRTILLTAVLLGLASAAHAKLDYTCYQDCTAKGYVYLYCQSRCSYEEVDPYAYNNQNTYALEARPQIDYKCYQDCTNKNYEDGYCKQECSY